MERHRDAAPEFRRANYNPAPTGSMGGAMRNPLRLAVLSVALFAACNSPSTAPATAAAPTAAPTLAQLQTTGVKNLAVPQPGLVTTGQPTEAQLEQMAALGVKRVVCLRVVNEPGTGWEEQKAKALGMEFVRLPVAGADGLTVANAQLLAKSLPTDGNPPTLLCCGSSNRVGALLAMKAFHLDGKTAEEALVIGKAAGLKGLEPDVTAKLKK